MYVQNRDVKNRLKLGSQHVINVMTVCLDKKVWVFKSSISLMETNFHLSWLYCSINHQGPVYLWVQFLSVMLFNLHMSPHRWCLQGMLFSASLRSKCRGQGRGRDCVIDFQGTGGSGWAGNFDMIFNSIQKAWLCFILYQENGIRTCVLAAR